MYLSSNMTSHVLLLLVTLFISCQSKNSGDLAMDMTTSESKMAVSLGKEMTFNNEEASPANFVERKIIRNGSLDFQTDEVKRMKSEIEKICKELNATVSAESENNYGERLQFNQMIRVPANQFDELVTRIESLASKIENKNITTQDVTEEFIDVEARLKTKKELEERYREILKQAQTVEDIVSIESQIANVRSEIESMEGRLNFLKNQVSLSTLNVTYYETIGTDFGFTSKLIQSLKDGWNNLLTFLIFLVDLWPFVIGFTLAIVWIWKKRKKTKSVQN